MLTSLNYEYIFLVLWGFMLGSMTGSIFVILYFREEILYKKTVKNFRKKSRKCEGISTRIF